MALKSSTSVEKVSGNIKVRSDGIYDLVLVLGQWKNQIPNEQANIIIADALNYCTYHKFFLVMGYLITKRRLCLVIDINDQNPKCFCPDNKTLKKEFDDAYNECVDKCVGYHDSLLLPLCLALHMFKKQVRKGIAEYWQTEMDYRQEHSSARNLLVDNTRSKAPKKLGKRNQLFREYPLYNPYIIALITGKPIHLKYYNPHLAKLEQYIHNYNFCSVGDYKGVLGPVVIQCLLRNRNGILSKK